MTTTNAPNLTRPVQRTDRVLLVEDSPSDARLVIELLGEAGWQDVMHVRGVANAALKMRSMRGCSVLLDLSLPDADGLEGVLLLELVDPTASVVVLTGSDDEGMAVAALQCGAQDYLVKDEIDGPTLARAIRFAAERKRTHVAAGSVHGVGVTGHLELTCVARALGIAPETIGRWVDEGML
jgi:DNA-binding response OmpR family regulator